MSEQSERRPAESQPESGYAGELAELLRLAAERELGGRLAEEGAALYELRSLAGRLVTGASGAGRAAAEGAASWVTDGNQASSSRLELLEQLSEGDPAAEELLPESPSLSGEYADSPTPRSLRADLTAGEELPELTLEEEGELEELLADCWEAACSERFQQACEQQLLKAEGLSGLTAAELAREYRERQQRYRSAELLHLTAEQEREVRLLAQLWQEALKRESGAAYAPGSPS